ncbi:hypothetical protein [uncultured Oceanicoccus sp.]|uniref:hypothetical protein n=1 Tax=uncultured Oceanicoccus sp. TaxID=1706381 RepID=UPI0030DADE97
MCSRLIKGLLLLAIALMAACESDNEHFCARYQYVYNQLLEDDLPSYTDMKSQLLNNLANPQKNTQQARFMLFVLEDWHSGIKPVQEDPREFCIRIKRWQAYQ